MTRLTHSFEAGVATGTAISAANSATGGNAFDTFDPTSLAAGALREYSTVQAKTGTLGGHFKAPTAAGRSAVTWSTSMGTLSTVWLRYYAWHASQTGGLSTGSVFFRCFSATTNRAQVGLNSTGKVTIYNAAGTAVASTTATVPTSSWYRVEAKIDLSASGTWEVRYFNNAALESSTPTETISGSAVNFGGTGTIYNFGHTTTDIGTDAYLDDIGIDSTGFLGPAVTAGLPDLVMARYGG